RLRDSLERLIGRRMPALAQDVRRGGPEQLHRVAFVAARTLECRLASAPKRLLLPLLELLARAQETAHVDLAAARELVHRPRRHRRLLQLLDRGVARLLR